MGLFDGIIRRREKQELKAVYDQEFGGLLENLDLKSEFKGGELSCENCGETITQENLGAISGRGNELVFICDDFSCINQV